MNLLCNDLLRLFVHYGSASTTYALSLSARGNAVLLTTGQRIEESKRRLTVIDKDITLTGDAKITSWTPWLPNNTTEGIMHYIDEYSDGVDYEIIPYRNNKRHGLSISYLTYIGIVTYVDGQRDGLQQWTSYTGIIRMRRYWDKGKLIRDHPGTIELN